MKALVCVAHLLCVISTCQAQLNQSRSRAEAEYYVTAYAQHYHVEIALVRAIIKLESDWQPCAVSSKGAVGLMQLMPVTAERLGVANRCSIDQNVAGGIRFLAWLMQKFHRDLRLVTAAYYAGEDVVARRGLAYRNPDVVRYVRKVRNLYLPQTSSDPSNAKVQSERDVR